MLRPKHDRRLTADPTVYARVDYLDPNANITAEEKASCEAILKNLPVIFTFAPMNLLHYQAKFPARGTRVVTVSYSQYAYADTRGSGSYQLAYVLHPATLWNEFGPIHLTVQVPEGIACKASVRSEPAGQVYRSAAVPTILRAHVRFVLGRVHGHPWPNGGRQERRAVHRHRRGGLGQRCCRLTS